MIADRFWVCPDGVGFFVSGFRIGARGVGYVAGGVGILGIGLGILVIVVGKSAVGGRVFGWLGNAYSWVN